MMEHENPRQIPQEPLSAPTSVPSPPVDVAAGDALIEDYLDHVCAPMVEVVPYEQRAAARAEMRAHLDTLIAAYEEMDTPHGEAVQNALRQFGDSRAVAARWLCEWELAGKMPPERSARLSARTALRCFGAAAAAAIVLLSATGDRINYDFGLSILAVLVIGLPLLAGTAVGLLAPARPVRATLRALALLTAPLLLLYLVWAPVVGFSSALAAVLIFGGMHTIGWFLFGTAAAGIAGLLRKVVMRLRWRWALR